MFKIAATLVDQFQTNYIFNGDFRVVYNEMGFDQFVVFSKSTSITK